MSCSSIFNLYHKKNSHKKNKTVSSTIHFTLPNWPPSTKCIGCHFTWIVHSAAQFDKSSKEEDTRRSPYSIRGCQPWTSREETTRILCNSFDVLELKKILLEYRRDHDIVWGSSEFDKQRILGHYILRHQHHLFGKLN